MGCFLSCCDDDVYISPSDFTSARRQQEQQQQQRRRQEFSGFSTRVPPRTSSSTSGRRPAAQPDRMVCDVCGCTIDSALFSGHRETCRVNCAHTVPPPPASSSPPKESPFAKYRDEIATNDHDACVVCYERMRAFAFIPCGHVACCMECSKKLDSCPVCRVPREGLCYVDHNAAQKFRCKHCNQIIMPTLFDGHREVCALRMRQLSLQVASEQKPVMKQEEGKPDSLVEPEVHAEGSSLDRVTEMMQQHGQTSRKGSKESNDEPEDGALLLPPHQVAGLIEAATPTVTADMDMKLMEKKEKKEEKQEQEGSESVFDSSRMCVECQTKQPLVVLTPCGHMVLCYKCASAHSACPLCMSTIQNIIRTFR